ncbi:hypothetical protein [Methanobacterium sp.]|uniref:hypothetical protein n=1 Tax=Methanobacterium sp. TaxID=2164 RepID=UPI002ABCE68D|nr:hypothetical protein [Methanobacterium sp.]MDY9924228.1 hypothetical protein [Methanobacterium sp.]
MVKKYKKIVNNQACGCLIDEILEKKENKDEKNKNNSRLCSASQSDMEFFVDPDPLKTSIDFYQRHLTDGLPIIPPTRERANRFLDYSKHDPSELLALLPPKMGQATPEKIAINSIMAGCLPQFQPVMEHVIQAISQDKFNLAGVNATTHPVSICTIINGPLTHELGMNSGAGCLGPGNMANATIGRALRLCLINIAGAIPGVGDHATHGSPAKYSYCFTENEDETPWDLFHVENGYLKDDSTVTVMAAEAPHNVNDHRSQTAEDLLETIIHTAVTAGCNNSHVPGELLVIMSPEHSTTISRDGWEKEDVKDHIHENALLPASLGDRGGRKLDDEWIISEDVRITRSPSDVLLLVAGGPGRHTMISHGFGNGSLSVTLPITLKDGSMVHSVEEFKIK